MNHCTTKGLALILLLGSVTLVGGIGFADQMPDDPIVKPKPKPITPHPHPKPVVHHEPIVHHEPVYDAHKTVMDGDLQWQDDRDAKTVYKDWEEAKSYCENLTLDGYSDWRLPSKEELESIVDKSRTPMIKEGFKNTATDDWYWSASPSVYNGSRAWIVGFYDGSTVSYTKTGKSYVRCVRGRQ